MLEFIVLGRIPGSQFIITYQWVFAFVLALTSIVLIKIDLGLINKRRHPRQLIQEAMNLESAPLTQHTGAIPLADIFREKLGLVRRIIGRGV